MNSQVTYYQVVDNFNISEYNPMLFKSVSENILGWLWFELVTASFSCKCAKIKVLKLVF
jgi:hypothetical protein